MTQRIGRHGHSGRLIQPARLAGGDDIDSGAGLLGANPVRLWLVVSCSLNSIMVTANSCQEAWIMSEPDNATLGPWAIFLIFLRLGLTSFGGPVAHLGYFREEFVARRGWLSERSYSDLVALCQFLPGPASSQVGMAIGLCRSGYGGAVAAWAGFTLPSALALVLLALGIGAYGELLPAGMLHGLRVVAVAVVAQAVWGMGRSLCPDLPRITIMAATCCVVLLLPFAWAQLGMLAVAALAGLLLFKPEPAPAPALLPAAVGRRSALFLLGLFLLLLVGLPLLATLFPNQLLLMVDAFYRAGALVFGGGHVVLPLLQAEVVAPGWVSNDAFLAGYGAAQAVPGPLFTRLSAPDSGFFFGDVRYTFDEVC